MSKQVGTKNKKKKNFRLRKSVRRTLGALFMISAIIVAAIPFPDAEAADPSQQQLPAVMPTGATLNYSVADDATINDKTKTGVDLDPTGKNPLEAFTLRQDDSGVWIYEKQFDYYVTGTNKAIISKYNSTYSVNNITLTNRVNGGSYITETQANFDAYFTTSDPAKMRTLTYGDKGNPVEERFKYYFPLKHNEYISLCTEYEKLLAEGQTPNVAMATVTADPTKDLSTASNSIKGEYYADYVVGNGKLNGLGCYMEYVEKATGNNAGAIYEGMYVARLKSGTSDNIGNGYRSDNQGFLYSGLTSYDLVGIGNRAFENVKNVSTITLPETLQYIGDYAFSGSFVEVISIKNVEEIGNHAFESSLLRSIDWGTKTTKIGTEAFRNTNLVNVSLPYSIMSVGEGAFSNNSSLASISFDTTAVTDIAILKYAFYNCPDLGTISLRDVRVKEIGEGAFALNTLETGNCTRFEFPALMEDPDKLGDLVLSGRMNLKEVLMPAMMGVNGTAELKPNLFYGCANLACVEFPAENGSCGYVKFPANLFASVTNDEFYVLGPELNRANQTASPRSSTWECVNGKNVAVPYMYVSAGKTYYEVKSGDYLLTLDINNTDKTASVSKCDFAPGVTQTATGELSIPDNVGPYKIIKLADGCISPNVKKDIKNLTIGNSITEVGDGVFQGCTNMLTLDVGDSVTSIGANAFQGCTSLASANIGGNVTKLGSGAFEGCIKLENISFEAPVGGTASFPVQNIGDKALTTGSNKLTIKAVAAKEYGPFAYSMDPSNYVNEGLGVRIYYRTPEPSKLGIILDNRNNYPTLVDYPKFEDLKNIKVDDVDDLGQTTGTTTNLLDKYQSGKTLTPAEEALINATLFLEIPDGVDSIDVRGYLTSTSPQTVDGNSGKVVTNRNSVAAYFSGADYPYRTAYEDYGLFTGAMKDPSAPVETEVRGDDNLRSVVMRSVRYLPESDIPTTSDGTGNALRSGGAFYSCEALERVDFGSQMEKISGLPFLDCTNLQTVESSSPKYECINKILYENITSADAEGNQMTTRKIVECLPSRGITGDAVVNLETDPILASVSEIADGAFMRCQKLGFVDLTGTHELLKTIPNDAFREDTGLVEVTLPNHTRILKNGAFEGTADNVTVWIYGKEVDIEDKAFNGNPAIVRTYKDTAAYNAAVKIPGVTVRPIEDNFRVVFISGMDGSLIKEDFVEEGGRAYEPEGEEIPKVAGYTFSKWSTDAYKNVKENLTVVAIYAAGDGTGSGGGTGGTGGGTGGTGGGTGGGAGGGAGGTGGGNYDANGNRLYTLTVTGGSGSGKYAAGTALSVTANGATSGKSFTHWSSNQASLIFADPTKVTTSFTMPAADTTVTANYAGQFTLTVKHGSGGGSYPAGAKVEIEASPAAAGTSFLRWTATGNVQIASVSSAKTTLTMPAADTTVTANYTNSGSAGGSGTGGSGTGGSGTGGSNTTGTASNNRTSIIITKPGISNTNQASAYVTGSSDGFIVRITESAEATQAALEALQRQYSDMNPIKFFAMDISLYDSTGTQKITDTTGLKINITIPIPDELRPYLGNNKIAAVANGSLEPLAVKFVTINGVPSMSFTATHFSPYTVYVDTGNLTLSNNLDVTPKTGDGIHPKWFLSLGLASISMILFLKKDRKYITRIS